MTDPDRTAVEAAARDLGELVTAWLTWFDGDQDWDPPVSMPERRSEIADHLRQVCTVLDELARLTPLAAHTGAAELAVRKDQLWEENQRLKAELGRREQERANVAGLLNTLNAAYRERAQLLGLAAVTYPAFITEAVDVAEPGWHLLVLTIDGHQATWHIAPSDMGLWSHVPYVQPDDPRVQWDGHTTEQKYERILDFTVRVGDERNAADLAARDERDGEPQ